MKRPRRHSLSGRLIGVFLLTGLALALTVKIGFNFAFQKFMSVFAQPDSPLVLFMDNLQWVDSASLKLLEIVMKSAESQCLYVIGAYREEEISPVHPLSLTLDKIQSTGSLMTQIHLSPLQADDVTRLVADTLHTDSENCRALAKLLLDKTNGNRTHAAKILGISVRTLRNKLNEYKEKVDQFCSDQRPRSNSG